MDLDSILQLEAWANSMLLFRDDDNLTEGAIYMLKATECLKNAFYKEAKEAMENKM